MKIGFIKPTFPNEKRVSLLPKHIKNFPNEIYIEENFADILNIKDEEYVKKEELLYYPKKKYMQNVMLFHFKKYISQ